MTVFERVKYLSDKQGISIVELEEKLNFSRNSLYAWKRSKPSTDKLEAVADFFGVTTDYLLGREDKTSLAEKHGVFAFDGEPVSDEEVEFLKSVLAAKRATDKK